MPRDHHRRPKSQSRGQRLSGDSYFDHCGLRGAGLDVETSLDASDQEGVRGSELPPPSWSRKRLKLPDVPRSNVLADGRLRSVGGVGCVGESSCRSLQASYGVRMSMSAMAPPALSLLLWDVLRADLCAPARVIITS